MQEKRGWFDKKKNLILFLRIFYASLVVLLVLDLFVDKHPYFGFDGAPSFSAAYGFISCVLLVLFAKILRMIVMKGDEYYDR
ncbi:MAG: hypothetical protein ACYDAI_03205 [Trichloromonadaceae bacterium]